MSQQEPSKRIKKAKNKTFAKSRSLLFLANKKRWLLTTNEIVQAIECEKGHLLKLIGVQQPVTPQSEANRQSVEEQPVMGTIAPNRSNKSIATRSVVAVAITVALDLWRR
ncbi:hypothetical protein KY284_036046 [Solanum tuberosum]|nr:hypothetical protein KY284_036046 [Solanum tuberosum]